MRGKLAKAIRKATRFHPADERRYREANVVRKVRLRYGIPIPVEVGSYFAVGARREYQELKQRIQVIRKRGGRAHA